MCSNQYSFNINPDQDLAMAFNRNLRLKSPMHEDFGISLEEAFNKETEATMKHYQAKLWMCKQLHDAMIKKHDEERQVSRIQGKLELFEELFKDTALTELKEKLESELVLAEAKASDVKIPYIDWYRLKEPQMFE